MSTSERTVEDPFAILGETLESAANSMEGGEARARSSAHRAADATKRVVGSGAYSTSYGLAYGAVWIGTYLHDLLPPGGVVQRGFADGAHDSLAARILRLALAEEQAAHRHDEPLETTDAEPAHAAATPHPRSRVNGAGVKRGRVSAKMRDSVDKMADTFEHKA